jgi:hypothetical protein
MYQRIEERPGRRDATTGTPVPAEPGALTLRVSAIDALFSFVMLRLRERAAA